MSSQSRRGEKRRSGRVTPYCLRKAARLPDILADHTPTTNQLEGLKCIVSRTWHLFHASPLWRLGTTRRQLALYSQQLSSHITSSVTRGGGDGVEVRGLIAEIKLLKRFGLDGSDALHITVSQTGARAKKGGVLEGIMCRMNHQSVEGGFSSLPILLLRGGTPLIHITTDWLQTCFDCHISPVHLLQEDLVLLVGQYATAEKHGRGLGGVELVYSFPAAVKKAGLSTVAVEIPFESAATVWNGTEQVEGDRRKAFVQALQDHLHRHFHLKLEKLMLSRISTPVLHAERDGRLKFTNISPILPTLAMVQSTHY